MKKTIKKLETNVIRALTRVCETAKDEIPGFVWLTHSADYANFPASLTVTCIFDTIQSMQLAIATGHDNHLDQLVRAALLRAGVVLKANHRHLVLDNEEACHSQHGGDWARRLQQH